MILIDDLREGLKTFKALSSESRIKILELLSVYHKLNMNELAEKLDLTNGAITSHVKKLEECGLIKVSTEAASRGNQKLCYLHEDKLIFNLKKKTEEKFYQSEIAVGHFSDYDIYPTCGLANKEHIIGEFDDPSYFADPARINSQILWFSKGFIEYRLPNYLKPGQELIELQISMEISSEAPGVCSEWPSDIFFYLNELKLGSWTSPGDFGETKGIFTPSWWYPNWNQYGLLKLLSVNKYGTFIDGSKISEMNLTDLNIDHKSKLKFKLVVPEMKDHLGGLTIFGKNFGNYNQNIYMRLIYK
ncbi:ArsR/SmtB family transcription factor [Halanaerobium salsuginis]|uniref:Transcriptional regulator, ArsR family n=1 Tax=Halanaerobium salsuginis TaxID=29563 RepID=A0A1I4IFD5_9FIRM|nr:winged helix-turn-helix transcriptional regulator [Halanaerobium salsuginis]SFL52476.1 transcriptional regulator, ArsR family [Halanaerobium salsuginis]